MKSSTTPKRLLLFAAILCSVMSAQAGDSAATPAAATLVLGAGCFWCVEGVYEQVEGVLDVVSGFAGGHVKNPTYEQVCGGKTGHAEVVKITYDPRRVSREKLVELFWKIHDPTDPSGVWPDFGPMYRSILLAADAEEKQALEELKQKAQAGYGKPIATEIALLGDFYPAETYHQDFVRNNPGHPYVRRIAQPKIQKAQEVLSDSKSQSK